MIRRVLLPLTLSFVALATLAVAGVATGLISWPPGGRSETIYASDRFARELPQRWGSAETGGDYIIRGGEGRVDVDGSVGTMHLPKPGSTKLAMLGDVEALDVDARVRIAWDKWPVAGRQFAYIEVRAQEDLAYRPKLVLAPNGSVEVSAGKVVDGDETELGTTATVAGLEQGAGEYIWLRARVVGTNPTQIMVRAWADGSPEPVDWPYTVTDATEALQVPGAIGIRAYLGLQAGNAPATVSFDDLLITRAEPLESTDGQASIVRNRAHTNAVGWLRST